MRVQAGRQAGLTRHLRAFLRCSWLVAAVVLECWALGCAGSSGDELSRVTIIEVLKTRVCAHCLWCVRVRTCSVCVVHARICAHRTSGMCGLIEAVTMRVCVRE